MEKTENYSFQTDSEIVINEFNLNDNFLIEFNLDVSKEYCIIYFSSNDIYYPNDELTFMQNISVRNKYEWFGTRIEKGHKHIFIRDIKKQWYLGGINANINSPQKLLNFLKTETFGYKTIFIGSSAGGFASVIYGQLLHAESIFTFNGQFEINSILNRSTEAVDPLVFRNQFNEELKSFYDTRSFIKNSKTINYLLSADSPWDVEQYDYVKDLIPNTIKFKSSNHGIPFFSYNLRKVINMEVLDVKKLHGKFFSPLFFSVKTVGVKKTFSYEKNIVLNKIKEILFKVYSLCFNKTK